MVFLTMFVFSSSPSSRTTSLNTLLTRYFNYHLHVLVRVFGIVLTHQNFVFHGAELIPITHFLVPRSLKNSGWLKASVHIHPYLNGGSFSLTRLLFQVLQVVHKGVKEAMRQSTFLKFFKRHVAFCCRSDWVKQLNIYYCCGSNSQDSHCTRHL